MKVSQAKVKAVEVEPGKAERVLSAVVGGAFAFVAPVVSFFKARSIWQYAILIALAVVFAGLRTEIKAFIVTGLLTVCTALFGYLTRKLANPEFSVNELKGEVDEKGKLVGEVPESNARIIVALIYAQVAFTGFVFGGVLYLLPAIYNKV